MSETKCAIEVGWHDKPLWLMDGTVVICNRHKHQFETRFEYDDEAEARANRTWIPLAAGGGEVS